MTRDSWALWLGIAGGFVVYLGAGPSPMTWDWARWMQCVAVIIGIIAAKLASSPLPGAKDVQKVVLSKVTTPLLIAVLAVSSLAATCHNTPRHDSTINLSVLATSLQTLQAGEKALFDAHTIPALTLERHQAFNVKMVQVWEAMEAARQVILKWKPGTPIPAQLTTVITGVSDLLKAAAAVIGVALPAEAAAVWDAIVKILIAVGGTA